MRRLVLAAIAMAVVSALSAPAVSAQEGPSSPPRSSESSSPPPSPPPAPPPSAPAVAVPRGDSGGGDGGFRGGGRIQRDGTGEFRHAAPRDSAAGRASDGGATEHVRSRVEPSHVEGRIDGRGEPRVEDRRTPAFSRPRRDRTVVGEAVPRGSVPSSGGVPVGIYDSFYGYGSFWGSPFYRDRHYGYGWPYYWGAFGLGYFYYDPFWWSYPYYGGYGYPSYGGYGYGGYGGGGGYVSDVGSLRLKVKPRHAKVFVDGYFEGYVDNFDGLLQKMKLRPGPHRIEVRADGFEPIMFDVNVTPGETITYKADMRPRP